MNDNAKKWVKALRSGEFEQGNGYLYDGGRYCCLGVACELYRRETGDGEWRPNRFGPYLDFVMDETVRAGWLPPLVQAWLGLGTDVGDYGNDDSASLTADNDEGKSFADIATTIESEPEGLFA